METVSKMKEWNFFLIAFEGWVSLQLHTHTHTKVSGPSVAKHTLALLGSALNHRGHILAVYDGLSPLVTDDA